MKISECIQPACKCRDVKRYQNAFSCLSAALLTTLGHHFSAGGFQQLEIKSSNSALLPLYSGRSSLSATGNLSHTSSTLQCSAQLLVFIWRSYIPGAPARPADPSGPGFPLMPKGPPGPGGPRNPGTPEYPGLPSSPLIPRRPGLPSSPGNREVGGYKVNKTRFIFSMKIRVL